VEELAAGGSRVAGAGGGDGVEDTTPIPEGARNDTLFALLGKWRRTYGDDEFMLTAAAMRANLRCQPPLSNEEVQALVASALRQVHEERVTKWAYLDDLAAAKKLAPSAALHDKGFVLPPHPLTDLGNADRLIRLFGGNIRHTTGVGWMVWEEGVGWARDVEDKRVYITAAEAAKRILDEIPEEIRVAQDDKALKEWHRHKQRSQDDHRVRAALNAASKDVRVSVEAEAWDNQPELLAVANGVINLKTGELRKERRDDMLTTRTNVRYDPEARNKDWERYLWQACGHNIELMDFLARAVGYTLTASVKEEAFFILHGLPNAGKSTFIHAIQSCLGPLNFGSDASLFEKGKSGGNYALADLIGKRAVTIAEWPPEKHLDATLVKALSSGDTISARQIYQRTSQLSSMVKIWISTNYPPRLNDVAIWRRVQHIPFTHPAKKKDASFLEAVKSVEGAEAILAWAVRGAKDWYTQGLNPPDVVQLSTEQYRQEEDVIEQMLLESFEDIIVTGREEDREMTSAALYLRYVAFCGGTNEYPKTNSVFGKEILRKLEVRWEEAGRPGLKPRSLRISMGGMKPHVILGVQWVGLGVRM
jgi:putative DNA primase/helicase